MSDGQRSFLAFGLIAVILILTPKYLRWLSPSEPAALAAPDSLMLEGFGTLIEEEAAAPQPAIVPLRPSIPRVAEKRWEIETDRYRAVISSRGGGTIARMELFGHKSGLSDENVQMIPQSASRPVPYISYINLDGDSVALVENWEIVTAPRTTTLRLEPGESQTFTFRNRLDSGAEVTRKITLRGDGFHFPMEVAWRRPGLELGINVFELNWSAGLLPAEAILKEDETYAKAYVYQGSELADMGSVRNGSDPRQTLKGNTDWVAIRNKYFAAALIAGPGSPGQYGAFAAQSISAQEVGQPESNISRFTMALGYPAQPRSEMSLYLGPLSYSEIKGLDVDLERIMNFGFALIRPVSKGILWTMVALHDYIPNYGVILILFAIAVRIITNPLTRKSATSTQKMQLIQPRITELQAKYKGNPQKLNKETMALWRSEGVNPLGGCLPILIQLPLLWAFFIVFRTTIELRGQPFIWWVKDLSVPDVIFTLPFSIPLYGNGVTVLALIMGITMFVQQKVSGMGNNPQQKPMMYMMTAMFFLLFNQFPSGLNLYYAFSNILSIFQQRNIRRELAAKAETVPSAPSPAKSKPPVKRSKRRKRG
ncbi:MAG: membrane protein insertase YidC [Candidatus Marinimicrobia bacterium]|nr:membrane protein insertase YidC [Candidatus Neomarinimicrobiota bacterium]